MILFDSTYKLSIPDVEFPSELNYIEEYIRGKILHLHLRDIYFSQLIKEIRFFQMESIPSEVRLYILEYEGTHPLGLRRRDLIDRILFYDPSFSYSKWKRDIRMKEDTLKKVLTPGLEAIYEYVTKENILISIESNGDIAIQSDKLDVGKKISDLITKAGYKVFSLSLRLINQVIIVDNSKQLWMKLVLLWILKGRHTPSNVFDSYMYTLKVIRDRGMERLIPRLETLSTPPTLPEYLRYVRDKSMRRKKIEKSKLISLYYLLNKYPWYAHTFPTHTLISLINPSRTDVALIEKEINRVFSDVKVITREYMNGFEIQTIPSVDLSQLQEIDTFLHPNSVTNLM